MSQELRRGNLAGHGWQCRNHAAKAIPQPTTWQGPPGSSRALSDLRCSVCFDTVPPCRHTRRQPSNDLRRGAKLREHARRLYQDGVRSYGHKHRHIHLLVRSSEPIFSVKDEKKAWLIAVVLSIGNAMNGQPDAKVGDLYVADADMEPNVAYVLPIDLAKSLQNEVAAGQAQAWSDVRENRKELGSQGIAQAMSWRLAEAPTHRLSDQQRRRYDDSASDMVSILLRNMSR